MEYWLYFVGIGWFGAIFLKLIRFPGFDEVSWNYLLWTPIIIYLVRLLYIIFAFVVMPLVGLFGLYYFADFLLSIG